MMAQSWHVLCHLILYGSIDLWLWSTVCRAVEACPDHGRSSADPAPFPSRTRCLQADSDDQHDGPQTSMSLTAMRTDDDAVDDKRGLGSDRRASTGNFSTAPSTVLGNGIASAVMGWMSQAMAFGSGGAEASSAPRAGRGKQR
jgi:hypothetical protein